MVKIDESLQSYDSYDSCEFEKIHFEKLPN